jgi:ABC-type protease/lipase transport system fused ATPase/permease subunit
MPRHQPIVAAPQAAEIARLAVKPAADWRDPSIALAAREHARGTRQQIASLNRRGVVVLNEPDDKLDRAVLAAYLQLRRPRRV